MTSEQEWEQVLQIKTTGRDDSHSDAEHHPYEPTDYCVLERLTNSGYITKQNTLIDLICTPFTGHSVKGVFS